MAPSPAELERVAASLPRGAGAARVRELLGEPLVVSPLADGGETWLYVEADLDRDQGESLSLAFDAQGGFTRLERKAVD